MVALNKPAAGDTDWTTEINDNWTTIEGVVDQALCQGRITLSSGNPAYNPQPKTPSSTDTGADTVDFSSAHGWTTGTMIVPDTTGGGLTSGTTYYINAVDADTVSFHTTLANAEAGTSKVNLTASITSVLRPSGVARTTVYFSPYKGNRIAVYSGSTWKYYTLTEISLSLSGWTASKNSDIFIYDNSGTLTLERVEWTSDTVRATAIVLQDGVYVKSGATTRRYLGTIRTIATTGQCEDSLTKRFVMNYYNRLLKRLYSCPGYSNNNAVTTFTLNSTTWTAMNGGTGSKLEYISNGEDPVNFHASMSKADAGGAPTHAIAFEEDTANNIVAGKTNIVAGTYGTLTLSYVAQPAEGYRYVLFMGRNSVSHSIHADFARQGASADVPESFICAEVLV